MAPKKYRDDLRDLFLPGVGILTVYVGKPPIKITAKKVKQGDEVCRAVNDFIMQTSKPPTTVNLVGHLNWPRTRVQDVLNSLFVRGLIGRTTEDRRQRYLWFTLPLGGAKVLVDASEKGEKIPPLIPEEGEIDAEFDGGPDDLGGLGGPDDKVKDTGRAKSANVKRARKTRSSAKLREKFEKLKKRLESPPKRLPAKPLHAQVEALLHAESKITMTGMDFAEGVEFVAMLIDVLPMVQPAAKIESCHLTDHPAFHLSYQGRTVDVKLQTREGRWRLRDYIDAWWHVRKRIGRYDLQEAIAKVQSSLKKEV